MAISGNNLIGSLEMISLVGQPNYPDRNVQPYARAGVDSHVLALTGIRAAPFQIRSFCDFLTVSAAHDAFKADYQSMKGSDLVNIIWHGTDLYAKHGCKFAVLDVKQFDLHPIIGTVGGLVANSRAMLVADWLMLAIVVAPEEEPEEDP